MAAPITAEISVTVSGKQVWIDPPNFVSLDITRTSGDTCNAFTLQVLDTSAFDLEYALLNNTGGNITIMYTDKDDYKSGLSFTGYVIKLSDSFYGDRFMLTLTGFVGVTLQDMYDRYSVVWNIVPKFNWTDVFTDVNSLVSSYTTNDNNSNDGFWESLGNWFKSAGTTAWAGLCLIVDHLNNGRDDTVDMWRMFSINPEEKIDELIDTIKIDKAGNYYVTDRRINAGTTQEDATSLVKYKNVKQSGSIVVPMRPSKIIKLIARGGYYSDLLEDDFESYKGTNFYDGDNKVSEVDWLFIQRWFKKLGKFKGCGWKCLDSNIADTDLVQDDFTQTKQSFLKFISSSLVPKSRITTKKVVEEKSGASLVRKTVTSVRANFYFYFDSSDGVHFRRLNITNNPESTQAVYYLYGDSGDNVQHSSNGHIVSFNPSLDVLTSMITCGAETGSGADISNINLVTGEPYDDIEVQVSTDEEDGELSLFKDWGDVKLSVTKGSSNYKNSQITKSEVQQRANAQAFRAEATIEGCCNLNPQDYIEIIVLPKDPKTGGVTRHHTSGYYFILKIKETIADGRHYAVLDLVKNVGSIGDTKEVTEVSSEVVENYGVRSNGTILEVMTDTRKNKMI